MPGVHKLAALVIHGMGTPDHEKGPDGQDIPTFHDEMAEEIGRRLRKLDVDPLDVAWEPVFWHPEIGPRQNQILDAMRAAGTEWNRGRRFALAALGDAGAYTYNACRENSVYHRVHETIHRAILRVRDRLDRDDRPMVFFANSLGGIMMSDYIWDRRSLELRGKADPRGVTEFERFHTLASIVTFGCNIPLFVHGFQPLRAIEFPHPALAGPLQRVARWHNFYDEDDVLGYPLRPLGDDYKTLGDRGVLLDRPIESGPIFARASPLSHTYYWTDNDFTRPAAEILAAVLAASA